MESSSLMQRLMSWMASYREEVMGIPQIIMIIIMSMNVTINLVENGKPRDGKYSFFGTLFGTGINIAILWWGGFFG